MTHQPEALASKLIEAQTRVLARMLEREPFMPDATLEALSGSLLALLGEMKAPVQPCGSRATVH